MRDAVNTTGLGTIMSNGTIVLPAPTFHSLRHTHASALIAQGWDIEEVSARLGHADTAITQKIYVHAFDHARRSEDRRRRLGELYGRGGHLEAPARGADARTRVCQDSNGRSDPSHVEIG